MKKLITFFKKFKKGFTLMECVCAIAVVGLLSSIILPLTATAMKAVQTSDALRVVAAEAAAKNASVTTDKNDTDTSQTMYVTVDYGTIYDGSKYTALHAESAFVFTKTSSSDENYLVSVTYYDLKYGKEEENIK